MNKLKCNYWIKLHKVEAESIEDYLNRYYKKDRFTDTLIESYKAELKRNGYVCTSHHDNVTGELITWYPENN